jgi:DNA-directed RNA polymerase specialized sigma subunit
MIKKTEVPIKFSGYFESKKSIEVEKNHSELAIVRNALKSLLEREPSIEELAKALGCSYKDY